jgi:hypothetical protein
MAIAASAFANPYLAKVGERSTSIRIATCAVSGGFIHLYAAIENNLFEKSGFTSPSVICVPSLAERLS